MSNESHPSPSGSSSSTLFGGGGNAGGNEPLTQPSPAKPTWAQILNSNPNAPSNTSSSSTATGNNNNNNNTGVNSSPSSSSPASSQHSTTTKTISPSASGTLNTPGSRAGFMPNFYDQTQSQMNWPLNFNQTSSWMINDDNNSQKQPSKSLQQSNDNTQTGGDGFERIESSSPTSGWNKPVTTNNSTANGWSNFQQQQQQQTLNNPSRSNPNSNQWPEMNNFYGANTSTNSFNLSQQNNDNNSSSTTWQDPSSNTNDMLTLTTNNPNSSKHKSSSIAASLTGALKSAIALSGNNIDHLAGNNDPMITYVPQPKLVEQLGWDEPDINVLKRANFDDGTSIWGDPMESMSVPVKKWTNGPKAALTNSTNIILSQPIVQKQISTTNSSTSSSTQMVLNDENWPKQQSPTLVPQSTSQWNDTTPPAVVTTATNVPIEQPNTSQQQNYRTQQTNWNPQSHSNEDWYGDGLVDTSQWDVPRPPHKAPFDPYDGQVDTTDWVVPPSGGIPGQLPIARTRFMNEYDLNENPHDIRMPNYDNQYRQNPDLKNSMMNLGGILPPTHHSFSPRPSPLYPQQSGNILRPINPNGGLSTPPGAIIGQNSHLSPKLPISSPVPNQPQYVPLTVKQNNIPNQSSQTPTPSQQQSTGNGNNNNNNNNSNNNGAVHAQIMQQFRLAVQAGLISQDLLNTKLPPYMLQLLQKLFELQQKFQQLSIQLSELSKNKPGFPLPLVQNEYECLSKLIAQKKQEMLIVQKEIQDAHTKLKQQSTNPTPTPSQMMSNGPNIVQNTDQSRLTQWTKQSTIGGQRTTMFPPPGLTQKDWQTDTNDPNENWDHTQTNESNNNNNNNQISNIDSHTHNNQVSSSTTFSDPFSNIVDDIDGPPPFVPGQLWNWKSSLPNAEDDPNVTPSSLTIGPKGSTSVMTNLNVGGVERAFSNPPLMHQYQRPVQSNRPPWQQGTLHDQQGFQPPMNDWSKQQQQQQQQYRGISKAPSLPHPSFGGGGGSGGHRPYM
ncbi:unnamed protein product [Rotaria sp. Silwood1]|nr:unnamed protein product [Rotaria sp. Silwood1]CAF4560130.1 unnamed protein product [Rotaria sp. Silwood1]CAF4711353.1 unnamed protein product [Rotaria sp. Silwood1]